MEHGKEDLPVIRASNVEGTGGVYVAGLYNLFLVRTDNCFLLQMSSAQEWPH